MPNTVTGIIEALTLLDSQVKYPLVSDDSQTNATATATLAAPGTGWRNRLLKVDASYSTSATSGVLTVNMGTNTFTKYVHGSGAIDFADIFGIPADSLNTAITVTLAAGGVAIIGNLVIQGYKHYEG